MFNNNPYSFNANYSNFLPTSVGYRIYPVGKIKEVDSFYPDLQGNPLFFYDQSENSIYVKQRNIKTLELQEHELFLINQIFYITIKILKKKQKAMLSRRRFFVVLFSTSVQKKYSGIQKRKEKEKSGRMTTLFFLQYCGSAVCKLDLVL